MVFSMTNSRVDEDGFYIKYILFRNNIDVRIYSTAQSSAGTHIHLS